MRLVLYLANASSQKGLFNNTVALKPKKNGIFLVYNLNQVCLLGAWKLKGCGNKHLIEKEIYTWYK